MLTWRVKADGVWELFAVIPMGSSSLILARDSAALVKDGNRNPPRSYVGDFIKAMFGLMECDGVEWN
ncbi:hypothetical protein L195_g030430, partial [Trifolium pratense]